MGIEGHKVFVIVVTYKGWQWYDRCFRSLPSSSIPVQTIVVDNASNDGSVEYIRTHFPEIHIIPSDSNLGFGQANNKGIRYALDQGCDYVFLLNQDAWIEENTISKLIDIHLANTQYGILSPIHLDPSKSRIEKGFLSFVDDYRTTDRSFFEDCYFGRTKDVYGTSYVNAAAWLLPRNVLTNVGGFDPIFFHYGEDDNYMRRVLFHGFKIGVCPYSRVVHDCNNKGVREYSEQEKERRRLLLLLTKLTDITLPDTWRSTYRYSIKKYLLALMKGDRKQMQLRMNELQFLKKNKDAIQKSKEKNQKKGETWL